MLRVAAVLAAMLLSIASCFLKPDRPAESGPGSDGGGTGGDASIGDDAPDPTTCGVPVDDFSSDSGSGSCGTWGTISTLPGSGSTSGGLPGSVGRDGAQLRMTAPENYGAGIQCQTTTRFDFSAGTSVRIVSPLQSNTDDRTFFRVVLPNDVTAGLAIQRDGSGVLRLQFECGGMTAVVNMPLSTGWLKLMGKDGGQSVEIVAQYSTTGGADSWTDYANCFISGSFGDVHVAIGTQLGSGSSGNTVQFDDLNIGICP